MILYFDVDPYEHYVVEEETAAHNSRQVAKKMPRSKSLVNYEDYEDSDESSLSSSVLADIEQA